MINRFVCHLSSLSGEQWYGSQEEKEEGDTGGREKQHTEPYKGSRDDICSVNLKQPPNGTVHIQFVHLLSSSNILVVRLRFKSIFWPKLNNYSHSDCSRRVHPDMHRWSHSTLPPFEFIITLHTFTQITNKLPGDVRHTVHRDQNTA